MVMQLGRMLRFYTSRHSILGSIRKLLLFFLSPFLGILFFSTFVFAQTTITYNYDIGTNGIGRLSSVSDPTGSATFSYDVRGNITQSVKVVEGNSFTTTTAYDSLNRITSITYPDNENVGYTYDPAGNLKTVGSYVTNVTYNSFNQRATLTLGNGTSTTYSYDSSSFRLNRIYTTGPGSVVLQNLNYCHDAVGNITRIRADANCTDTTTGEVFGYDHLNRLTAVKGPYGDFTASPYSYDPIGNLMYNPQVGSYSYPASGVGSVRPHAVTTAGANSYSYDANGNMLTGAGRTINYDAENRPTSITQGSGTITMAYNYKGDRVKKATGQATTYYVGALYEKKGTTTTKYIFAGSSRIALKSSDGTIFYYHGNHLGSTHVVTNASGASVEQIQYNPFGGSFSDSGSLNVNHKYTSQELDSEIGFYYYRARYYDPILARFISADTVGIRISKSQTLNRYSYVLNNPLRYTDPTGHVGTVPNSMSWNTSTVNGPRGGVGTSGGNRFSTSLCSMYCGGPQVYGSGCASQCNGSQSYNFNGQGLTVMACHPDCSGIVPKAPPGANINANIYTAAQHFSPLWFLNQVSNSGEWDYKKQGQGSEYEDFGNFNYGATGAALGGIGIPDQVLLRGAGAYGMCCGTYDPKWGVPWGGAPYGDDPHDQEMIKQGIQYTRDHTANISDFTGDNSSLLPTSNPFNISPTSSSTDGSADWGNDVLGLENEFFDF